MNFTILCNKGELKLYLKKDTENDADYSSGKIHFKKEYCDFYKIK